MPLYYTSLEFIANPLWRRQRENVLLVDDMSDTGGTLAEAALKQLPAGITF
jgi:hypoxanthine phosphoribosyltransferase